MALTDNNVFEKIKGSFDAGRLVPFVGAGLSMGVPDFPSWNSLLIKLRELLKHPNRDTTEILDTFDKLRRTNPLECAEYFCHVVRGGRKTIRKQVHDIIDKADISSRDNADDPLKPQELLVTHFNCLYTTNYDRLLEEAWCKSRCKACTIYNGKMSDKDRKKWLSARYRSNVCTNNEATPEKVPQIVKYHGDYREIGNTKYPESLVVTERDYYRRLIELDAKDIMLMRDLLFYDFLFIGYGFGDISVKYVFHQIGRLLDETNATAQHARFPDGRLFFVTLDDRKDRIKFLETAYNVSAIGIGDLCGKVCVKDSQGTLVYNRTSDATTLTISCRPNPCTMTLSTYQLLHELAELETESGRPVSRGARHKLCEFVKTHKRRTLTPRQKKFVCSLLTKRKFTELRAKVTRACYTEFLNKLVTQRKRKKK